MQSPNAVDLLGMDFASLSEREVLDHLFSGLDAGEGGWLVTANLDILRRHTLDPEARALYGEADLRVADGMPLVWASRLAGSALPERVAGSTLIWRVAEEAARRGRSLYLLGGAEGAAEGCRRVFESRWPDLRILGTSSPWVSSPPTVEELEPIRRELVALAPDIVLVGLGSPKQEYLCRALRQSLPRSWQIGVGVSFSFAAGKVRRAPPWMQKVGLEWIHRLGQEPGRLARRYLVDDLPFAFVLFGSALRSRVRDRGDAS